MIFPELLILLDERRALAARFLSEKILLTLGVKKSNVTGDLQQFTVV
jgi:hypothetical protein